MRGRSNSNTEIEIALFTPVPAVSQEVLIENRQETYGNKDSRQQHFYSKAELLIFKRAWHWHVKSSLWPVDRLMRCGCPACVDDEGRVPEEKEKEQEEDKEEEEGERGDSLVVEDNNYSRWTWEG